MLQREHPSLCGESTFGDPGRVELEVLRKVAAEVNPRVIEEIRRTAIPIIEEKIIAADTYGRNQNGVSWGEWLEDQGRRGTSLAGTPPANGWDRPTLLAAWRRGDQACNWRVPGGAKEWTPAQMG